jgi:hypothetical protein
MSGSFTKINNIKWYTDGTCAWTYGTGGAILVGATSGCPSGSYVQATGTEGTTGESLISGHTYYQGTDETDATTYTSASPLNVDDTDHESEGDRSCFVVTQTKVAAETLILN